ncbi:MAG: inositol monophosphatase [Acidimicrobiia bacterium]|nr:inositol monophosphatase [Acidimicrobiia bacterium]
MAGSDFEVALEAARAGAAQVASGRDRPMRIDFKSATDPATEIDYRSEQTIIEVLARHLPDDPVVGEERGGRLPDRGRVWLVDPLDGTTNFIHGFPWVAVSVALWIDNLPAVGVVLNPLTEEEYTATRGGGAHLNGSPLRVSSTDSLARALVVTGFPYDPAERIKICDSTFRRVLEKVQGIRRLGSAALDLCMVAQGRMDGYWEEDLSPWDMGAGVLIVSEAGGTVTGESGHPLSSPKDGFVVATNGLIHRQMIETLSG